MNWLAVLSGLGHAALATAGLLVYVLATRIGHQRRHPSAAAGWVVAMVGFPYVALPLFLLIGTRKFVRPVRRPRGAWAAIPPGPEPISGAAWATQLLACMELAPAVPNNTILWHADGDEALRGLMRTIASATHSLDVCTFVFASDAVGEQVAQALLRAVQRRVAVRLLVDAVGSLHASRRMLRQLREGGVQVQRFMPLLHNPMRGRTNLRNHRKLVLADRRSLWSGGRNLAAEYFTGAPGQAAWVDLSFEVHGPLAEQAAAQFAGDWLAASGRTDPMPPAPVHGPAQASAAAPSGAAGPAWAQWVPSGPDHADDTVHTLLLAGAYHARRRIVAVTPYFVPDDALLAAWCLACRRGVQVQLLVPRRSNHRLADWARERALRELAAAGAQVWLAPGMVHAKAVLMDDDLALAGSLNLDARSLFLNYEAMAAFYGAEELRWLSHWCDAQIARAQPYHARKPTWVRDVAEGVVRSVGFQL